MDNAVAFPRAIIYPTSLLCKDIVRDVCGALAADGLRAPGKFGCFADDIGGGEFRLTLVGQGDGTLVGQGDGTMPAAAVLARATDLAWLLAGFMGYDVDTTPRESDSAHIRRLNNDGTLAVSALYLRPQGVIATEEEVAAYHAALSAD